MTKFVGYESECNFEEGYFITPHKQINRGCQDPLTGYWNISLKLKDGTRKMQKVHRAVWQAYNNCYIPEKFQIMHLDDCRSNNCYSNLKVGTARENCLMVKNRKKSVRSRYRIPVKCCDEKGDITEYESITACATALNLCQATIGKVLDTRKINKYYHHAVDPSGKKFSFVKC
jgi:hypothetical protein